MKILQYPRNNDGTPMSVVVGLMTDNTGNNGNRLTNQPLAPDGSPINAVALLLVDITGTPIPLPTGGVISGASAYERAVANGFVGTEAQWLTSLHGAASTIPGPRGSAVLSDSDDPTALDGLNGDFWINTTSWMFFGPKAGGVWPAGIAFAQGPPGNPGTNGNTILNGAVNPVDAVGANGDFYINIATWFIFGPKAGGHWPAGVQLTGGTGGGGGGGGSSGQLVFTTGANSGLIYILEEQFA